MTQFLSVYFRSRTSKWWKSFSSILSLFRGEIVQAILFLQQETFRVSDRVVRATTFLPWSLMKH